MVFYTVIMAIIDLSVSRMLIEQDLRRTGGQEVHFRVLCVCWRESNLMEK